MSSNKFNCRFYGKGYVFDHAAASLFVDDENLIYYILGYLNSCTFDFLLKAMNPTINSGAEIVSQIPMVIDNEILDKVMSIAKLCVKICEFDWNSFETSWDFKRHPLLSVIPRNSVLFDDTNDIDLAECYTCWESECNERFNQLKANEEELNRIFIDIYGLQDELTPEAEDNDVTVRKADLQRDIKSLISYAVG